MRFARDCLLVACKVGTVVSSDLYVVSSILHHVQLYMLSILQSVSYLSCMKANFVCS